MFKGNYINIFLIIVFIITGGTMTFGFSWSNFSIPTPLFKITDSLLIILYLLFVSFFVKRSKIKYTKTPIKYYYFFILLFFFELIKNIVLFEGSISKIIIGGKYFYVIFFIFPLIKLIKTKNEVKWFTNALIILGILNGLVYYFQFITGIELPASNGGYYNGVFRVNLPGFNMIIIAFFLVFSRFIVGDKIITRGLTYIILLFFISIFVVTLSRGLILGIIISTIIVIRLSGLLKKTTSIFYFFFLGLGLFIIGLFLVLQFNFQFNSLTSRLDKGYEDITQQTGTYKVRSDMMAIKMEYILLNHPFFGVGFLYHLPDENENKFTYYHNPIALNTDATYHNIVIVMGYIGLFLWLGILFQIFKTGKRLAIFYKENELKSIALSMTGLSFFIFIHGFSSNYFNSTGLTFLTIILGYTFWLYKFALKQINENRNSRTN